MKIALRNEPSKLFFQDDVYIVRKTRLFITFTSITQMEWIKALHVDNNMMYEGEKKFKFFLPDDLKIMFRMA